MSVSDSEGELLVQTARYVVEEYVIRSMRIKPSQELLSKFQEKRGVFVTITSEKDGVKELRGCIGLVEPNIPLITALFDAAVSAAVSDPRFEPVTKLELDHLLFEVSILTIPKLIEVASQKEYLSKIRIGKDGLIVQWKFGRGLLLPQVPVEEKWDVEEYLVYACMKAGASPDSWLLKDTKIYSFEAEVFGELSPRGPVSRHVLI